jgi:hypothetical protein
MQNLAIKKACHYFGAALVGVLLAANAQADSAKLMWSGNGHYYQRFDLKAASWAVGKYKCEAIGGHLATITSVDEQGFIVANFTLVTSNFFNQYAIGGVSVAGKWKWITGEPWGYSNFIHVYNSIGYLKITKDGTWFDSGSNGYPKVTSANGAVITS